MKLKYNDKIHAYWLDGKRCKGMSTLSKVPDDTFSLDQWRKRMVLLGVARKPELAKQAAAHHDDRDKLNAIAEEALVIAGASDAANAGTATHRIIERHILGEEIILTDDAKLVVANFAQVMESVGLRPIPEAVEQVVVYPEQRVAGRFDHLAYRIADDRPVVVDVKTGASAIRYPHATSVQLAGYANAPLHATLPIGRDGVTEEFLPPPEGLDREVGYVVSMTDEGAHVYSVNLKLGWKCLEQIIFPTLNWRSIPAEKLIKRVG